MFNLPLTEDGKAPFIELYTHDHCNDGLASWMVFARYINKYNEENPLHKIDFCPNFCSYGKNLSEPSEGSYALFIDFTPPSPEFLKGTIGYKIIDHHESCHDFCIENYGENYVYDKDKCGSELAWNLFFPSEPLPKILQLVRARDLWRFDNEDHRYHTDVIHTALMYTKSYMWYNIDEADRFFDNDTLSYLYDIGETLVSHNSDQMRLACSRSVDLETRSGYKIKLVNSNSLQSDIGDYALGRDVVDVCIIWHADNDGQIRCSARSSDNSKISALEIAQHMGGGGHKRAAGFRYPTLNVEELKGIISTM